MKKIFALIAIIAFTAINTTTYAQEKKSHKEIAKEKTHALKELVALEDHQVNDVFEFYLKQIKEEEMIAKMVENNDPKVKKIEGMKDERAANKEATLKKLLTEEQYKIYSKAQ